MIVSVLGKRWRFDETTTVEGGDCDAPTVPRKTIRVNPDLPPERHLDVTLHELLHASDWHKDEEWVAQVATDVARVLWRLGYRRESP